MPVVAHSSCTTVVSLSAAPSPSGVKTNLALIILPSGTYCSQCVSGFHMLLYGILEVLNHCSFISSVSAGSPCHRRIRKTCTVWSHSGLCGKNNRSHPTLHPTHKWHGLPCDDTCDRPHPPLELTAVCFKSVMLPLPRARVLPACGRCCPSLFLR